MWKSQLPLSRHSWLIAVVVIAIILILIKRETDIMQTILNISSPDVQLGKIDNKITVFNLISLVAIAITFIAGIFLIIYNINGTKLRNQKIANLSESLLNANEKIIILSENVSIQNTNLINAQNQLAETQIKLKEADEKIENSKKSNLELATNLEQEKQKTIVETKGDKK